MNPAESQSVPIPPGQGQGVADMNMNMDFDMDVDDIQPSFPASFLNGLGVAEEIAGTSNQENPADGNSQLQHNIQSNQSNDDMYPAVPRPHCGGRKKPANKNSNEGHEVPSRSEQNKILADVKKSFDDLQAIKRNMSSNKRWGAVFFNY